MEYPVQSKGITKEYEDILPKEVNKKYTDTKDRMNCFDLRVSSDCTLIINDREFPIDSADGLSINNMIIESLIIKESGITFKMYGGVDSRYV